MTNTYNDYHFLGLELTTRPLSINTNVLPIDVFLFETIIKYMNLDRSSIVTCFSVRCETKIYTKNVSTLWNSH